MSESRVLKSTQIISSQLRIITPGLQMGMR
jgi:hypothetical protein